MTSLKKLAKTTRRSKKRVGRGYGGGKGGHTTTRGTKGQKARSKVRSGFEGGQTALIHRLPLKRGVHNRPSGKKPVVVNLKYLNLLPKDTAVTIETLVEHRIVRQDEAKRLGVKVLGGGELTVSLKVALPVSQSAAEKIKKAGGEVVAAAVKTEKKDDQAKKGKEKKAAVRAKKPKRAAQEKEEAEEEKSKKRKKAAPIKPVVVKEKR